MADALLTQFAADVGHTFDVAGGFGETVTLADASTFVGIFDHGSVLSDADGESPFTSRAPSLLVPDADVIAVGVGCQVRGDIYQVTTIEPTGRGDTVLRLIGIPDVVSLTDVDGHYDYIVGPAWIDSNPLVNSWSSLGQTWVRAVAMSFTGYPVQFGDSVQSEELEFYVLPPPQFEVANQSKQSVELHAMNPTVRVELFATSTPPSTSNDPVSWNVSTSGDPFDFDFDTLMSLDISTQMAELRAVIGWNNAEFHRVNLWLAIPIPETGGETWRIDIAKGSGKIRTKLF